MILDQQTISTKRAFAELNIYFRTKFNMYPIISKNNIGNSVA